MFEVSFIASLHRQGNKEQQTEMLRTASSYYMPEGRFFEAPVILKQKKQNHRVLPVFLGAGLSILAATSIHKADISNIASSYKTILTRDLKNAKDYNPSAIDPVNTSGIAPLKNDRTQLLNDQDSGKKLSSANQASNKDHINKNDKTVSLQQQANNDLPDLSEPELPRVSTKIMQLAENIKHVVAQKMPADTKTKDEKLPVKIAVVIPQKKPVAKLPVPKILKNLVTNDNPDVLALGYAPANAKVDTSAFDSVLTEHNSQIDRNGRFIPPIGRNDHAWAATPLPAEVFSAKEQKCLAEAVYFEARGEAIKGQAAVAQVVLNRVRNPAYPKTICGVVYQNTNWLNHCQFSFACDGRKHRITEMAHWTVAQQVARAVTAGQIWFPEVGSATHYHAVYVRPRWARTMIKVDKIGLHIFYRTRYGGWI